MNFENTNYSEMTKNIKPMYIAIALLSLVVIYFSYGYFFPVASVSPVEEM